MGPEVWARAANNGWSAGMLLVAGGPQKPAGEALPWANNPASPRRLPLHNNLGRIVLAFGEFWW